MRIGKVESIDRNFIIEFNSQTSNFKTKMSKTTNVIGTSIQTQPTKEEIYYDEVVYYDGGGVEGYGY